MLVCLVVWDLLSRSDAKALGAVCTKVAANAVNDTATMKDRHQICRRRRDKILQTGNRCLQNIFFKWLSFSFRGGCVAYDTAHY